MAVKTRVLILVIACVLLLIVGIDPPAADPVRALPGASAEPTGMTIPYAGRLSDDAGQSVADGAYDLSFALYGTATGGDPIWSETQRGVAVANGQFLTNLGSVAPIPATALGGRIGWLAVGVRGPGETGFTALSPRQLVSVTAPAATTADAACPHDHLGEWWSGDPGTGNNGLRVESTRTDSSGITGVAHNGTNAVGVFGWTTQGVGVQGSSDSSTGVIGTSNSGTGVAGKSDTGDGLVGESGAGNKSGVYGNNTYGGYGVTGRSSHVGVYGIGNWGGAFSGGDGGAGVYAEAPTPGVAGYFEGDVRVTGYLYKLGGGFKIDHPLDPANQYLQHSFVESPDMKNLYDGVVTLDLEGEAVVDLPDWFGALNRDFRYQLTCIGGYAPVYIAEEISENQFKIAGGTPGLKVSWQVTGIRQDPYAEQHRIPVEEDKPPDERGTYLYPEGVGLPASMKLDVLHQPLEEAQP